MIKDTYIRLYNDLVKLDPNKITVVTTDNGVISMHQLGITIMLPYIKLFHFTDKKFKYGLLTQAALTKLLQYTLNLIQDSRLVNNNILASPARFSTKFYTLTTKNSFGPEVIYNLEYCNITNRFFRYLLIKFGSPELKLCINAIKSRKSPNPVSHA